MKRQRSANACKSGVTKAMVPVAMVMVPVMMVEDAVADQVPVGVKLVKVIGSGKFSCCSNDIFFGLLMEARLEIKLQNQKRGIIQYCHSQCEPRSY